MDSQLDKQTVTQTKTMPMVVEVDGRDVFVIMLVPQNMLQDEICGWTISKWVDNAVMGLAQLKVEIRKSDDIMTIVKNSVIDKKYCVVVYADTPLIRRASIDQALEFAATYGHKAVQMPRGWVFDTEHVKTCINNIDAVAVPNLPAEDFIVAYNCAQVALINTYMRTRINDAHLAKGVKITDPYNVYIDADAQIGKGTRIGPGVVLRGECKIGSNCVISNFVEIKKSTIGDGTKIKHMSYVGDAIVGKNCSIGCGVVFCNYDGREKHTITVGNGVFIGSNSNLIAPLVLEKNAYIAAGSTISQDVPANGLGIARARQAIKENWRVETAAE